MLNSKEHHYRGQVVTQLMLPEHLLPHIRSLYIQKDVYLCTLSLIIVVFLFSVVVIISIYKI
jgi:hypothetical protein